MTFGRQEAEDLVYKTLLAAIATALKLPMESLDSGPRRQVMKVAVEGVVEIIDGTIAATKLAGTHTGTKSDDAAVAMDIIMTMAVVATSAIAVMKITEKANA